MMKRTLIAAIFALGVLISAQAFALELSQARAQGIVGENLDGYIAAVTASAEAGAVVSEVNTRRRAEYEKISKENGQPVSVVAKVAAERIINGLPSGSYYKAPDGSWKRK
jgi:uncharacterized protein YdbL (DUF1318 family)